MTLQAAPIAFVPLVVATFAIFEFSRSWVWYRDKVQPRSHPSRPTDSAATTPRRTTTAAALRVSSECLADCRIGASRHLSSAPAIEQIGLYDRLERAPYPSLERSSRRTGTRSSNNPCGICSPVRRLGPAGVGVPGLRGYPPGSGLRGLRPQPSRPSDLPGPRDGPIRTTEIPVLVRGPIASDPSRAGMHRLWLRSMSSPPGLPPESGPANALGATPSQPMRPRTSA